MSLLSHLWQRGKKFKNLCLLREKKVEFFCFYFKVKRQGQGSEAAVCQEPVQSSPACLCWRYLHRFCWWYNSAYILHSSLPLLQAVFNTAQDTLCQLKRILNADKTKIQAVYKLTNRPKKGKRDMRNHTSMGVSKCFALHTACLSTSLRG